MLFRCRTFLPFIRLLLATCLAGASHGQELRVVDLPVTGLDDERIRALAMDPKGALWLGTDRGLLRFDGGALERYVSDPADPRSMPSDAVYELLATPDGWIWAATPRGIFRLNSLTGKQERVPVVLADGTRSPMECLSLSVSRTGIWAFMGRGGLYHLQAGDSLFRAAKHAQGRPQRPVGGWEDAEGHLWYADRQAVRRRDPTGDNERIFPCVPSGVDPASILLLDLVPDLHDPNTLWCTSWGIGVLRFNIRNGSFTAHYPKLPIDGLRNIVHNLVQVGPDRWLVSMDDTLRFFDGKGFITAPKAHGSLGLLAQGGYVYIGSTGRLHLAVPPAPGVEVLAELENRSNLHVAGSLEDDGYWVVQFYQDRKLMRTDRTGKALGSIPFPPRSTMPEPFKPLVSRHGPTKGHVWVGTTKGLWLHVPGSGILQEVMLFPDGAEEEPYPYILDLIEDERGRLWMITSSSGLIRFDPVTGKSLVIPVPDDPAIMDLVSVVPLDDRRMLVAKRNAAPVTIDVNDLSVSSLELTDLLLMGDVEGAVGIPSGELIIYTRSMGIWRVGRDDGGRTWSTRRRWYLPDRPVLQDAVLDGRGRVWLSSDRGAFLLDTERNLLHAVSELIGLPSNLSGEPAVTTGGDVLLTGNSIVRCSHTFEPPPTQRTLLLRSARVNGRDLTELLVQGAAVEIPFQENRLTLTYGCIAPLDGSTITYSYQVIRDGVEQPWVMMDQQRRVDLLGLSSGTYTVLLRAEGQSFLPVTTPVAFTVAAPWWALWWARLGMLALSVLTVILLTRQVLHARYQRKLRKVEQEREVERVRMRIARDIHDGIGSGLTRIMLMTRRLGGDPEQAQRVAQASTELVKELGEIVWTVDPRNDSFGSFIAYVRSTLARQFEHLGTRLVADLRCASEDRDRIIGPELKRNVLLVMKEAVNNALKHSGASLVSVTVDLQRERLTLKVEDNGTGFDPENIREGANGLVNFRKRAEAVHGQVSLTSGPSGTEIVLTAPVPSMNM